MQPFYLPRLEPNEALEMGISVEMLIAEGLIPSRSLAQIHHHQQIVAAAAREGEALTQRLTPCFDVQKSTSNPGEF